ncbi:nitronate monooxygenase [Spongiimicrobium sp. 3-5]|uniref:nitronate monooxygenase n=1 Tax=Spongiimicrobium sp. 3-5 TaxID=3332596 RepID=UPI0039804D2E
MWKDKRATQLLGIKYPIIQGPFGGRFSSAELVSTISNLGGMGSFGLNAYEPEEILEVDNEIKRLTQHSYALNLWVPLKDDPAKKYTPREFNQLKQLFRPYFEELKLPVPSLPKPQGPVFEQQVEAVLKVKPPVMSFIFGIPEKEVLKSFKKAGTTTIGTATTEEEALLIEAAGLDLVVVSGAAAGGHRAAFLKSAEDSLYDTYTLVSRISKKIKIPIIAAGGIGNSKQVVEMLKAGASAVQIGTAFLATKESGAPDYHKTALRSKKLLKTSLTTVYTGRLARAISNNFSERYSDVQSQQMAPFPIQSSFLAPLRKELIRQGRYDEIALWAGQPTSPLEHSSATALFNMLLTEI